MCNNTIVLYIFILLKIIAIIILPLVILVKRRKSYIKILLIIDILLLLFFIICNYFTINKCVYNSTLSGIDRVKNENKINLFNTLHPKKEIILDDVTSEKKYRTYTNKPLYYYNQTKDSLKNEYYECGNEKVYLNTVGSSITSFSIAVSTLFDRDVSPKEIFGYYKDTYLDICNREITIEDIYSTFVDVYGSITVSEISKYQIEDAIINDGLVIAYLNAKEDSKLTCDSKYVVIYSIDLEGKYKIADPTLLKSSYVCPYSSNAYGNVIDSDNMDKSWTLDEIDNEAVKYYLVKKG